MIKPTLLIMAAGLGSRYGNLKQMDGFGPNGELIMEYSIYDALRHGFGNVVFVTNPDIEEDFRKVISSRIKSNVPMDYVLQRKDIKTKDGKSTITRQKPWGTAQALLSAKDIIKTPFAVINADDYYGIDAFYRISGFLNEMAAQKEALYGLVAYQLSRTLSANGGVSRGLCKTDGHGYLNHITEVKKIMGTPGSISGIDEIGNNCSLNGNETVSMNMFGFYPSVFKYLEEFFNDFLESNYNSPDAECYLPSAVNNMLANNDAKIKALETTATWFGITYKEDKENVRKDISDMVKQGVYPENLWG